MKSSKLWPPLIVGGSLLICFVVALVLRIVLPYKDVFTSNGVIFTGNDAYYQMRLVETFVHNFPRFQGVDPYLAFPGSGWNVVPSFFQWSLGVVIWVLSLGSPTEHAINVIGHTSRPYWVRSPSSPLSSSAESFGENTATGRHRGCRPGSRSAGRIPGTFNTWLHRPACSRDALEYHCGAIFDRRSKIGALQGDIVG